MRGSPGPAPCRSSPQPESPDDPSTGKTCRCESGDPARYAGIHLEIAVCFPRETRRSHQTRSTRAAGARRCHPPGARYCSSVYGRRMRCNRRSLACWSGRWKCGANRPSLVATRSTISGVQSMGSSELMRNVTSRRTDSSAFRRSASDADREIATVGSEVNAGDRDFLVPGRGGALHVAGSRQRWQAAPVSACRRDDAVAAALFTAGLHPQGERGAPCDPGLERRTARPVTLAEPHAGWQLALPSSRRARSSFSSFRTTRRTPGSDATSSSQRVA